jgi:hypothetical protein
MMWRMGGLHNVELHNIYESSGIVRVEGQE